MSSTLHKRNFKTTSCYYRKIKRLNSANGPSKLLKNVKTSNGCGGGVTNNIEKSLLLNSVLCSQLKKPKINSIADSAATVSSNVELCENPSRTDIQSPTNFIKTITDSVVLDTSRHISHQKIDYNQFETELSGYSSDESEITESEGNIAENISFIEEIRNWIISYKISNRAANGLLSILKTHEKFNYLPVDCRTILKTPKSVNIVPVSVGFYWHNGLKNCLLNLFPDLKKKTSISLMINIDGLPLHKSSKIEFWPILFIISEFPEKGVSVIGIYSGEKKANAVDLLSTFVKEAKDIIENGIMINGHVLNIKIKCFICDTPARTYIKGEFIMAIN